MEQTHITRPSVFKPFIEIVCRNFKIQTKTNKNIVASRLSGLLALKQLSTTNKAKQNEKKHCLNYLILSKIFYAQTQPCVLMNRRMSTRTSELRGPQLGSASGQTSKHGQHV
ncbi:hypothetical protein ATANTOWER_004143 [Ataeniobius toweri]|uniref:Uncharacterized protein n=1 Tax=Ataeniobius toweri TaxID=208326 RepID=A0ABU7AVW2_9TELE|nr:hypothetical protein [Ataeniobius toweri]